MLRQPRSGYGMPKRVSLFVTCLVDQLFPEVGLAMADVIERVGYEVEFREAQTCCGQPAFNSGFTSEARDVAIYFLKVFEDAEYIVVPSGSCVSMIGHHYSDLFSRDDRHREAAQKVASRVYEFSEFLLRVAGVEDVGARFPATVTYHDSCHALRDLGIKEQPRRLLANVRDLRLREMEPAEECCGFGGTFSVKFSDVSGDMLDAKIQSIVGTGADAVVSVDPSCLMQIRGGLSRRGLPIQTLHLAQVLASTA
jgi:L-lactate dehydrogenase complex protein LldE